MELALIVYLISVVSNLSGYITFFGIISIPIVIISTIVYFVIKSEFEISIDKCSDDEKKEKLKSNRESSLTSFKKYIKISFILALLLNTFAVLLPSEKTLYIMAGAYAGQTVYESEIGNKSLQLIEAKLDEYIEEAVSGKK